MFWLAESVQLSLASENSTWIPKTPSDFPTLTATSPLPFEVLQIAGMLKSGCSERTDVPRSTATLEEDRATPSLMKWRSTFSHMLHGAGICLPIFRWSLGQMLEHIPYLGRMGIGVRLPHLFSVWNVYESFWVLWALLGLRRWCVPHPILFYKAQATRM